MFPESPRIPPLSPEEFSDEQVALVRGRDSPMAALNLTRTLIRHPILLQKWMPFAEHMGLHSSVPARDREFLLLRIFALCDATYESTHHSLIARKIGLTDDEVTAAQAGGQDLPSLERLQVKAAEELVQDHCISDETWRGLSEHYTPLQMIELVFTGGMYILLSLVTSSLGIQPEPNLKQAWAPD